jgi:hypothetical protein
MMELGEWGQESVGAIPGTPDRDVGAMLPLIRDSALRH